MLLCTVLHVMQKVKKLSECRSARRVNYDAMLRVFSALTGVTDKPESLMDVARRARGDDRLIALHSLVTDWEVVVKAVEVSGDCQFVVGIAVITFAVEPPPIVVR